MIILIGRSNYDMSRLKPVPFQRKLKLTDTMKQDFETYLQQAREDFCKVAYKYDITDHLELRTEIDSLLIAYDQAVEALRKHNVVRPH